MTTIELKPGEKRWLCIEHGEKFTVIAETWEDALEQAQMWGGELIREYEEEE